MRHLILSSYDHGTIATLVGLGYSMQKIADTLGFSKSTTHYELQRVKPYHAQIAQISQYIHRYNHEHIHTYESSSAM